MADDVLEVCSKCGKMPRGIDLVNGSFRCSRCGNASITALSNDDYERVVIELDKKYQAEISKKRLETIEKVTVPVLTGKESKKSDSKKKAKSEKKKTVKKVGKSNKK